MCSWSRLPRGSKFCTCPRYMAMRVSLCPVPVAELCLSVSLFCRIFSLCHFRGCLLSYVLMRCQRFRTLAFQRDFRPSWQVNASVIVCILIDWVISLLPRGRFERGSWQIHVVAFLSQCAQFQWFTAKVSLITPVKKVEILHLSTLYGHACFSLSCPCGRTMFEFILVLSSYFAVFFVGVSGVTYWSADSGSVLLLSSVNFYPLDRSMWP